MSTDPLERLRVDVPTLEPDPVLLSRLAAASAAASASTRPVHGPGTTLPRMLLAAASVAAVAVTAWGVSHLPGGGSPPTPVQSPGRAPHSPSSSPDRDGGTVPGASTGPDDDVPTSPASGPLPGIDPGTAGGSDPGGSGAAPPSTGAPGPTVSTGPSGDTSGTGHGRSGPDQGRHLGQQKNAGKGHPTKPTKPTKTHTSTQSNTAGAHTPRAVTGPEKSPKTTP